MEMPAVPRVGDTIYFAETGGLGEMVKDGEVVALIVKRVSWSGAEFTRMADEEWKISISVEYDPSDIEFFEVEVGNVEGTVE